MKKLHLITLVIFFSILYIFFIPEQPFLLKISFKIIPIILMIIFVYLQRDSNNPAFSKWLLLGLFFCMLGDATIRWFLLGLSFFLVGHICYIVAFFKVKMKAINPYIAIFLLAYGMLMVAWIAGNIFRTGNYVLGIAVCFYIAVILTMGWSALQTYSPIIILGAFSFIFSDSILAINMFITDIPMSDILIMTSYYSAQLFFAMSTLKYSVARKKVLEL
ncbi:lysoplasmalogenase [Rummeliibacillus sp. NPDC094406]|uniref:lysoplasmalogenase n=1 Tax=Rummeliibacillus sp. NPDC094406 TaxID=3364511 RepID=UPI002C444462|nr:lysoplasmalogenase [Rummeliibacillus sp.]